MIGLLVAAAISVPVPISLGQASLANIYPDAARRADIVGEVWYRLSIDAAGSVKSCEVLQGTWSSDIDASVCELLLRRARFEPARDEDGRAVDSSYVGTVKFTLAGRTARSNAGHVVRVAFSSAGAVTTCVVKPIIRNGLMPPDIHDKCDRQGNARVFAEFLGRPTQGLQSAEIRTFRLPEATSEAGKVYKVRNIIADAEYDTLESGEITRCQPLKGIEAAIPPVSRLDLCALGGLAPNAIAAGRPVVTRRLVIDAVAN